MQLLQTAVVALLLTACVAHDKKIDLQDIEEDNLKSENNKNDYAKSDAPSTSSGPDRDLIPLEFLKNGLLRYFDRPAQPQQPRYVHQYAVNEPPEKPLVNHKPQISGPSGPQQAMVGYYSNVPMQIYLVPHYYGDQEQPLLGQGGVPLPARPAPAAQEPAQAQPSYVEVPAYIMPTGKAYVPPYQPQVTYVTYAPPPSGGATAGQVVMTAPTAPPVAPQHNVLTYQMPTYQYSTNLVSPPTLTKAYYQTPQFESTNTVEEPLQNEVESPKQYVTATQSEVPYPKSTQPEYPRYYNSRTPIKEEPRQSSISELPVPNPLLLRHHPQYSHIPRALPMYRPLKPVYSPAAYYPNAITPRPLDGYPYAFKKRPSSLLDSYVPSSVQLEYMKRGYTRDPLAAYEALASGRSLSPAPAQPRHLERGFLPNQMYHTAAGAVTYGHYKRTPKSEKVVQ